MVRDWFRWLLSRKKSGLTRQWSGREKRWRVSPAAHRERSAGCYSVRVEDVYEGNRAAVNSLGERGRAMASDTPTAVPPKGARRDGEEVGR
jgi:hypothetical protein